MALSANNNYLTVHADDWKCQVNPPGTVEPDFKFDGIDTVLPRSDIGHAEECPVNEALNQAGKTSGDHRWKHRDFELHRKTRYITLFVSEYVPAVARVDMYFMVNGNWVQIVNFFSDVSWESVHLCPAKRWQRVSKITNTRVHSFHSVSPVNRHVSIKCYHAHLLRRCSCSCYNVGHMEIQTVRPVNDKTEHYLITMHCRLIQSKHLALSSRWRLFSYQRW